jgi:hypothetical protein
MDFVRPSQGRPDLLRITPHQSDSQEYAEETLPYVGPVRKQDFRVVVFQPVVEEVQETVKKFSKDTSVFKPWIEDTFITINQCIANDI